LIEWNCVKKISALKMMDSLQPGANNTAALRLQIQRSVDLSNWNSHADDMIEVEMPLSGDSQFYRFAMPQN